MRAAIYWAPSLTDPLWEEGCRWLGRNAETGAACPQPPIPNIAALTADPRRYGLHATLRPPMRLATGWDEFRETTRAIARATPPFTLPPLEIAEIGGFLALRETAPCPALQTLANRCVELTNRHRLPPKEDELAKRRAANLSPRQEDLLQRWGYPYVMEEWFFHLTLTHRLSPPHAHLHAAATAHFDGVLNTHRAITEIAIFTQSTGDFLIAERFKLG